MTKIIKEVREGWKKLDREEYWTSNSHVVSIALLGLGLLLLAIIYLPIGIYYSIKYRRWMT